jgi:hypothetical protein
MPSPQTVRGRSLLKVGSAPVTSRTARATPEERLPRRFYALGNPVPVPCAPPRRDGGAVLSLVNPAHTRVHLHLVTEQPAPASLEIFDSAGRLVWALLREPLTPGPRTVSWDGRDDAGRQVGNGLYYCRFVSGATSRHAKIVYFR